jgi:hypothetical protein
MPSRLAVVCTLDHPRRVVSDQTNHFTPSPPAMLGATNPLASAPGTIRGDFALQTGRNVCHGSDSVESAEKEIALWFKPEELLSWESAQASWLYE